MLRPCVIYVKGTRMDPIDPKNTQRYYVDYNTAGGQHNFQVRFPGAQDLATTMADINGLVAVMRPCVPATTIFNRVRRSAMGTNLSFPVPFTSQAGTATGTQDVRWYANAIGWTGRSGLGRRVRILLFGVALQQEHDYRLERGEIPVFDAVLNYLQNSARLFVAVDGAPIIWNDYTNMHVNAYFQRKLRRTR